MEETNTWKRMDEEEKNDEMKKERKKLQNVRMDRG
jgi:hypothetical protein